jgi:hypothetical protein
MLRPRFSAIAVLVLLAASPAPIWAQSEDEITPESEAALDRGLDWLARNQGPDGNWGSSDLGLVSMGALAFMAAGHAPGRGKYGRELDKALDYVVSRAKPSGLLNIAFRPLCSARPMA